MLSNPGGGVAGSHLASGSPALGTGHVVAGNGGIDYDGQTVSATCAPDRGADQVSSAGTCIPLVGNGGFETGSLSPWVAWNSATVTTTAHTGTRGVRIGASPASAEQIVTVQPSTTYTLAGWAKVSATGNTVASASKTTVAHNSPPR